MKRLGMLIQYEELVRHIECPTCKGSGKIPKDSKEEYIALIPLSDKRLKPRHTVLKIVLAVSLCLIVCGLLLFFLIPRSVKLSSSYTHIKPYYININTAQGFVALKFQSHFNITNNNYVPLYVTKINVESMVRFNKFVLPHITVYPNTKIEMKTTRPLYFNASFTIYNTDLEEVTLICSAKEQMVHYIGLNFLISVEGIVLGQSVEAVLNANQDLNCYDYPNGTSWDSFY